MIVDGILNLLYLVLEPVVSVLPTGSFPTVDSPTGLINTLARFDYVFPFLAPLQFLVGVVASTTLIFAAYRIGLWLYVRIRG